MVLRNAHQAHDDVHRGADIMAHAGKKFRLGRICVLRAVVCVTERPVRLQKFFGVFVVLVAGYLSLFGYGD